MTGHPWRTRLEGQAFCIRSNTRSASPCAFDLPGRARGLDLVAVERPALGLAADVVAADAGAGCQHRELPEPT